MATYKALSSPDDFGSGHYIDWFEHPDGRMPPGTGYTAGNNVYDFGDIQVTIDVDGLAVDLLVCGPNNVRGQFAPGDPVVVADSDPDRMSLRLSFDVGIRAVGAHVGGIGVFGTPYDAVLQVFEAGGAIGQGRQLRATLAAQDRTAPFVALQCLDGSLIREARFDVHAPVGATALSRVAIGPLFFIV